MGNAVHVAEEKHAPGDTENPPSMTPAQLMSANTAITPTAISWRGPNSSVKCVPKSAVVCANHAAPSG